MTNCTYLPLIMRTITNEYRHLFVRTVNYVRLYLYL